MSLELSISDWVALTTAFATPLVPIYWYLMRFSRVAALVEYCPWCTRKEVK